ncbi:hypothetical protein GCM10027280_36070 [Micromonospora polyrhachis]|uniref:Uncharacterized protein n=1 Tax=Micromonospora polyrhachis TaxID=1282883 RepID=A0A7W7WPK4_9ACTN|nr:DUF6176 family protein [Micromonospora polyrhachis]MBB4958789.1 hypothetical protein [Micromonospora polyrhachis]
MIRLAVARVHPDQVDALRAWFHELESGRRAEALLTLADERCSHELATLVESSDGPLLVYAMEVEDEGRSRAAYAASSHAIDSEHRAVMAAALNGQPTHERVLDLRP